MFTAKFPQKPCSVTSGLVAGTLIESTAGWMPVEELRIGDAVQSYDGGLARVLGLDRQWIMAETGAQVLHVPGGAFDNCSDLKLLPGQNLLVDTLGDPNFPDDIVVLIPAMALDGAFGATLQRIEKPLEIITPRFADDEAIFANSGTLLHCSGIRQTPEQPISGFFRQLDLAPATAFLRRTNRAFSVHFLCHAA